MRTVAVLLAALIATPALAQDAPQATAPPSAARPDTASTTAASSVADQIDAFLRTSPAAPIDDGIAGVTPREDGKLHGEVSVGVGTGGYRSVYMRGDVPLGESGRLSVAVEDTRFGRAYGGPALLDRHRCGFEVVAPRPPFEAQGGPDGRCLRRLP